MLEQLATLNPDGSPPESRLTSAVKAYEIWNQLVMADGPASYERMRWSQMYDSTPPLNQTQLNANGQAYRVNVSWGMAKMVLDMAQMGYLDMIKSLQTLFWCPTSADLDPSEKIEVERKLAEMITSMIRSWPDFIPTFLRLTSTFIKEAVSFATFDDEWNWQFDSKGFQDVKIPRKTRVGQENIDVACWLRFYSMSQLYQTIKDPEVAEANGWNVDAVKEVIIQSLTNGNTFSQWRGYDWEKLEIELRNNDYWWTYGTATTQNIRIVHIVWQEFDGRMSYGIICDNKETSKWLYRKVGRYASSYNAFVTFTYGVGNDYYHGLRGQGYQIFPIVGALDRAYSHLLELGMFGTAPMLQPNDESAMQEMQFTPCGPYNLLTPGITVIPSAVAPNLSSGVQPILQSFTNMFREQTANANTQTLLDTTKEMSAAEFNGRLGTIAKMSSSAQSVFEEPWEFVLREMVRRIKRKDYSDREPGGKYVTKLRAEILKVGGEKLLDAFYKLDVDKLQAIRAVGAGSEAARQVALNQLIPLMPYLPESGRQNLIYDIAANLVTYRNVDRYTASGSNPAMTTQEGVAWTQNSLLMRGAFQPVLGDEDFFVHARVHAQILPAATQKVWAEIKQAAEVVGSGQPYDLNPIAAELNGLQMLNAHMTETVQKIAVNPEGQKLVAQYKQILQQADEVVHNGGEQLAAMMEKMQQAAAEQQGQPSPEGPTPETIAKLEEQRMLTEEKINSLRAKTNADIEIKQQKAQQDMALKDATTAQQITQSAAKARQQRRQEVVAV